MDYKEPCQLPAVARTEVRYLDMQGNPVDPHKAVRVITREYDAEGNLMRTSMFLDPSKAYLFKVNKAK